MDAPIEPERRPIVLLSMAPGAARERVARELHRRYSGDYRVVEAPGVVPAGEILRDARSAGEELALLLGDDPSAALDGTTIFATARRLFPDARRGLLIEWGSWADEATASVVLELMASVQIDYYVVVPSHSPDEGFHRTVTEFLLEWQRASGELPAGVTIVADDAQVRTHELRSLLTRAGIPHDQRSPDSSEGKRLLAEAGVAYTGVPLVRLGDGSVVSDPDNAQLAGANGLTTELPGGEPVDLAVVGAGPGGLAAAVYAASEGLRTLVLERESIGGQAGSSSLIRNYLGFSRGVSGSELAQRAYQQAWVFGARFAHTREAVGVSVEEQGFLLTVAPNEQLRARAVVLATGVSYRRLALGALTPYVGSAVFYGASAVEAKAQLGRRVHVVGGGNSAGQAALHLARYARSVSLVVRGVSLADSMSSYLIEQLESAGVQILTEMKLVGGGSSAGSGARLDHIVLRRRTSGDEVSVASDAVFITIGAKPHTDWLGDRVLRDEWGYVLTGSDVIAEGGRRAWPHEQPPGALEASVPGFFAVGDVRRGSVKRVASAVGEGSVVVASVHAHLAGTDGTSRTLSHR